MTRASMTPSTVINFYTRPFFSPNLTPGTAHLTGPLTGLDGTPRYRGET